MGLDAAYTDAWSCIESQLSDEVQTAKEVLSWISCATRPLTPRELQHTLAIEDNQSFLDKDNIPEIEDLITVCAGLVTIDEQSLVARLVHYTTQEYFEWNHARILPYSHREVGSNCIHYLCFDAFESGTAWKFKEYDARIQEYPLFEYAAENWGYHVRQQQVEMGLVLKLQTDQGKDILDQGAFIESRVISHGTNPLYNAVRNGRDRALEVLANAGADIEATTDHNETPLGIAAELGHETMVKLLLGRGAKVTNRPLIMKHLCNTLHDRGMRQYFTSPQMLSNAVGQAYVDVNHHDLLCAAATFGRDSICQILLHVDGVEIESKDSKERTPISIAAGGMVRSVATIRLMLERYGADPNVRDNSGRSPLSYAVQNDWERFNGDQLEDIVELLLAVEGIDIESHDEKGCTALHYAISSGLRIRPAPDRNQRCVAVVRLLLWKGARIESRDKDGETPLSYAVDLSHVGLVQVLIERGAEVDCKDDGGRTPLSHAVAPQFRKQKHKFWHWPFENLAAVAEVLLSNGADPECTDQEGMTPLSRTEKCLPDGHEALALLRSASSR
ncbi:ankyrin repeat-containing domain protein [Aspergillus cavernicola]|uniref:Ankyrin repeat-containing domain protein n=1 Tax=Aspergillus cavernicola TaxID=176166 RepID=A0ABR4J1B1_9EURO